MIQKEKVPWRRFIAVSQQTKTSSLLRSECMIRPDPTEASPKFFSKLYIDSSPKNYIRLCQTWDHRMVVQVPKYLPDHLAILTRIGNIIAEVVVEESHRGRL